MSRVYLNVVADQAKAFVSDESGATAIEYGLIAAGIAVAIVTIVFAVGDELETLFTSIQTALQTAP